MIGCWDQAAEDEINRAWARETWQSMAPYASEGVYVNYLGTEADEGGNRLAEAYGPGKFERLVALKRKYDPANLWMRSHVACKASGVAAPINVQLVSASAGREVTFGAVSWKREERRWVRGVVLLDPFPKRLTLIKPNRGVTFLLEYVSDGTLAVNAPEYRADLFIAG